MSTVSSSSPYSLLTVQEVATRTKLSVRHIWRMTAAGEFPKPIAVGRRCKRWLATDVDNFIRELRIKLFKVADSANPFDLSRLED